MMVMMVTDDYDANRLRVRETYVSLSTFPLSLFVELFVMVTMMVVMMMVVTMLIFKC